MTLGQVLIGTDIPFIYKPKGGPARNNGDNTFTIEGIVSDITDDPERTDGNAFACAFDMLGWYGMEWHLDDTMYMKVPNEVFAEFADPDNKNPDLFLSKKDFFT